MKKLLCILFSCLLLSSCGGRYRYTTEDRPPIFGYGRYFSMYERTLESVAAGCDLVIEGKVLNRGRIVEVDRKDFTSFPMTEYKIKIKDVPYGTTSSKKIRIRMEGRPGELTCKPQKGDQVILFLEQPSALKRGGSTDIYSISGDIPAIFVITADGLQTLTEDKKDRTFNGCSKEELYAYIEEVKGSGLGY